MFLVLLTTLLQAVTFIHCGGITSTVVMPLTHINGNLYGKLTVIEHQPDDPVDYLPHIYVLFDTTFNHVWVADNEGAANMHASYWTFDKDMIDVTHYYDEDYGQGFLSGYWAINKLTLKTEPKNIQLNLGFGLLRSVSSNIRGTVFVDHGAIFGLNLVSYDTIEDKPVPSIDTLMKEISKIPTFGFYINKLEPSKSVLVFGEPDSKYLSGPFTGHNVVATVGGGLYEGWILQLHSIVVGETDNKEEFNCEDYFAQLDSSSPHVIVGPSHIMGPLIEHVFSSLPVKGGDNQRGQYEFDCAPSMVDSFLKTLPVLIINIDGHEMELSPEYYVTVDSSWGKCYSNLIADYPEQFTLGRAFMTRYFTKFDYKNKKVHFAKSNQD